MRFLSFVLKGISAGILIGIATTMYLLCPNKIVGAFLFCFGLLVICMLKYTLFTGVIGYVFDSPHRVIPGLIGNILGVCGFAFLMRVYSNSIFIASNDILVNKIHNVTPINTFISALVCGMLMFIAVEIYNRQGTYHIAGIVTAIPCFILCGFDHSIVNMFHMSMSSTTDEFVMGTMVVGISLLGNTVGALIIRGLMGATLVCEVGWLNKNKK